MYTIERRKSGFLLTFSGNIGPEEMQRWSDDSKKYLAKETGEPFGVIVNMQNLQPMSVETNKVLVDGQRMYKLKGMKRSAVILKSEELCNKLKNVALQSGIYVTERYIDASKHANAIELAINWVNDGVDPDKI